MIFERSIPLYRYLIFVILSLLFMNRPSCAANDKIAIPFNLTDYFIMLDVRINDNPEIYKFVFDTGGITTINPKLFDGLKITPSDSVDWPGLELKIYKYMVDSMRIGPVKIDSFWMPSFVSEEKDLFFGSDGIVGPDFFDGQIFTIDYKNRILILSSDNLPMKSDSNANLIDYEIGGHCLAMEINLTLNDSVGVKATFDTGSPAALILPITYIDSLKGVLGSSLIKSRGAFMEPVFGVPEENYLGRIQLLEIGNEQFRNIPVYFFDNTAYIGKELLQAFNLSIDQRRNQILLERNKDVEIANNIIDYGFSMRPDNSGHLVVKGVWEGSTADKAGINPGDEVLEIDGMKVSGYSYMDIRNLLANEKQEKRDYLIKGPKGERRITLKKGPLLPEVKTD